MSNNFHVNPKEERLNQMREELRERAKRELFSMESEEVKRAVKYFSKQKFLTDPGAAMLYQDLPQVKEMIDKLDGQEITEPYIKIGLGECRIALLPSWCEERRDK